MRIHFIYTALLPSQQWRWAGEGSDVAKDDKSVKAPSALSLGTSSKLSLPSEPFLLSPKITSSYATYTQPSLLSKFHHQGNQNNSFSISNSKCKFKFSHYSASAPASQKMNKELSHLKATNNIDEADDNVTNVVDSLPDARGETHIYHERRDLNEISHSVDCPQILNVNNASEVLERVLQELELIRMAKEGNSTPEGRSSFCWY